MTFGSSALPLGVEFSLGSSSSSLGSSNSRSDTSDGLEAATQLASKFALTTIEGEKKRSRNDSGFDETDQTAPNLSGSENSKKPMPLEDIGASMLAMLAERNNKQY